jgi:hypothetical protein
VDLVIEAIEHRPPNVDAALHDDNRPDESVLVDQP